MIAENIGKSIRQLDNRPDPGISVLMGVPSYPSDGINSTEVLKSCDNALLAAKDMVRNLTYSFS